jgi:hypothetical protein
MEPVRQRPAYMHPAPSRAVSTTRHSGGRAKIAGYPPRRSEFGPGEVHGALLVDKVALEQYFLSTLTLLCQITVSPVLHIHPSIIREITGHSSKRYSIVLPQENK